MKKSKYSCQSLYFNTDLEEEGVKLSVFVLVTLGLFDIIFEKTRLIAERLRCGNCRGESIIPLRV